MRYIILGRIVAEDELSADGLNWLPLPELPELIPPVMRGDSAERLQAARRWENERGADSGDGVDDVDGERRQSQDEVPAPALRHEDISLQIARRRRLRRSAAAVAFLLLAAFGVAVLLHTPAEPPSDSDCLLTAHPGVNWNHCAMDGRILAGSDLSGASMNSMSLNGADLSAVRLAGADLSFSNLSRADLRSADLRGARLLGASLRNADLTGARLDRADLAYADLRGALLLSAGLEQARLDSAIWIDGRVCGPGSLGECKTVDAP
jgi:uncharacterized protein YjbI with pentapeptide repeats